MAETRPQQYFGSNTTSNYTQHHTLTGTASGLPEEERATSPYTVVRTFLQSYAELPPAARDEEVGRRTLSAGLEVEVTSNGFELLTSALAHASREGQPSVSTLNSYADWWLNLLP